MKKSKRAARKDRERKLKRMARNAAARGFKRLLLSNDQSSDVLRDIATDIMVGLLNMTFKHK